MHFSSCLPYALSIMCQKVRKFSLFFIFIIVFYIKDYANYKVRFQFCWVWKSVSNLSGFVKLQNSYKKQTSNAHTEEKYNFHNSKSMGFCILYFSREMFRGFFSIEMPAYVLRTVFWTQTYPIPNTNILL